MNLTTKQKEQKELLDLFDSLFLEHAVFESRKGVFLVLILSLIFVLSNAIWNFLNK